MPSESSTWEGINKLFGFLPIKIEKPVHRVQPSPLAVELLWKDVVNESQMIEKLFHSVYEKLNLMREWQMRGFADLEAIEQAKEWFDLRVRALPLLLYRHKYLDETFEEGAGI